MNYLVQRGKVRGQVINVPDGLPELLSDIAREALRCQPAKECLCQFIIDYLHTVIVTREKATVARNIIDRALKNVDEIITDMCICDITKEKADEMALVMEECFRRFLEKRRCERGKEKDIIRFDQEDMLDELIAKCKFSEDELKVSRPLIEEAYNRFVKAYMAAAESTDGTEILYQYFRERELRRWEDGVRQEAAIKIQAGFRGYLVRRSLTDKLGPQEPTLHDVGPLGQVTTLVYQNMDRAARIIQRFFKGRSPCLKSFDIAEEEEFDEEELADICSQHSKETILGEEYETLPDQKPVTPTVGVEEHSEVKIEMDSEADVKKEMTEMDTEAETSVAEPPKEQDETAEPQEEKVPEGVVKTEAELETPAQAPIESVPEEPSPAPIEAPAEAAPAEEAAAAAAAEPSEPAAEPPAE